jgi:DNA primase
LIIRKEETGNFYDRFRGRLMFPICDEQGRVIGFSGRVLSGDEKTAKYVNSPETPIFTKSKIFFGLDKSKRSILDAHCAIICEGQLDLIACFMNGVQNIVAPQGTAFTEQHARILKRYADEVVLCFDSDNAGQTAAVRALDHLLASGLAVRVAVVPAPHDPDSFIKAHGGAAFSELIKDAEGFFDYYLNRLGIMHDVKSDKGRLAIVRAMAEAVHKTGNEVLIDTHAQKTALRLGVSVDAVRKEFSKIRGGGPVWQGGEPVGQTPDVEPETLIPPSPIEVHLLKLLLLHEDLVGTAAQNLRLDWLVHAHVRRIVDLRLAARQHETWHGLGEFLDGCESAAQRNLVTEAVAEDRKIPNPEIQLTDVLLKLRNQFFDRQIAAVTQKIGQPQTGEEERLFLLREQMKLKEQKRLPLAPLQS